MNITEVTNNKFNSSI